MTNNPVTRPDETNFRELETIIRDLLPKITQGEFSHYKQQHPEANYVRCNGKTIADLRYKNGQNNTAFIAHSPEIAKAFLRAMELLRECRSALKTVQWNPTQSCLGEVNEAIERLDAMGV